MMRSVWQVVLVVVGLLLTGCSGGQGGDAPGGENQGLGVVRFSSCDQLADYVLQSVRNEERTGGWGKDSLAFPDAVPTASPEEPGSVHFTGTNLQEQGVDEADLVKADGDYLYLARDGQFLIIDAWPPEEAAELARATVEGDAFALFVDQGIAAVFSRSWAGSGSYSATPLVLLTLFVLEDPTHPRPVRQLSFEGYFVDVRLVDGRIHLATSRHLSAPDEPGGAIEEHFPVLLDRVYGAGGEQIVSEEPICPCEQVYRPDEVGGRMLLTLSTVDLAVPLADLESVSVLGDAGEVYGSRESFYVAAPNRVAWADVAIPGGAPGVSRSASPPEHKTVIHKFALGAVPRYVASGEVPGWVPDQFAMSEREGVLRVATVDENWWSGAGPKNAVYLLRQEEQGLDIVSALEGLGKPGERIYAVRFLGERGYVVTFQQTDPLYVLDLSDSEAPRQTGELEIPGFSTYLHPFGENGLLAVGRNTDLAALELSLFDVSDPGAPLLLARHALSAGTYSEAEYDHHAFTFHPALGALALPVSTGFVLPEPSGSGAAPEPGHGGVAVFAVDRQTGFTLLGGVDHAGLVQAVDSPYGWSEPIRRSMFLGTPERGDYLYTLSHRGLQVNSFADLQSVTASVAFGSAAE